MNDWISTEHHLPIEDLVVETKIDDDKGARNETTLKRRGSLWWTPDGAMYVYYYPTHWQPLPAPPALSHPSGLCSETAGQPQQKDETP